MQNLFIECFVILKEIDPTLLMHRQCDVRPRAMLHIMAGNVTTRLYLRRPWYSIPRTAAQLLKPAQVIAIGIHRRRANQSPAPPQVEQVLQFNDLGCARVAGKQLLQAARRTAVGVRQEFLFRQR